MGPLDLATKGNDRASQPAPATYREFAEKAADEATADLLTQRMQVSEKTAWMSRSLLARRL